MSCGHKTHFGQRKWGRNGMWMDLGVSTGWSKSEKEKQISHINVHVWNLEKWCRLPYLQSRNRDTDIENKCMDHRRSVIQSCATPCDPMDCRMPGFPDLHHLPELKYTLFYNKREVFLLWSACWVQILYSVSYLLCHGNPQGRQMFGHMCNSLKEGAKEYQKDGCFLLSSYYEKQ